jgi:hypothetical protein
MGLPRAWQTGLDGKLVPFGKHKVVKEVEFITQTSLPSWLTGTGTQTQLGPDATYHGSTQFTTAATIGSVAAVTSSFQLDSSKYTAILFELEALRFLGNTPVADARFFISGASHAGAYAQQSNGDTFFEIVDGAADVVTEVGYNAIGANEANVRRCTGFMIAPVQKEVYLLDSGGIVGYHDAAANWVNGLVNFGFKLTAQAATAVSWRASVMRFSLWWN